MSENIDKRVFDIMSRTEPALLTYEGSSMLTDGIIDSFQLIEILNEIEESFGIEVDAEFVVAERFANRHTVAALVREIAG